MANFVRLFQYGNGLIIRDMYRTQSGEAYIAGDSDNSAVLGKLDAEGNLLWMKRYTFPNGRIYFRQVLRILHDQDDLFIYGGQPSAAGNRSKHLFMRVTPNGDIVWSKLVYLDKTRSNVEAVSSYDTQQQLGLFYVIGWYNQAGTIDNVELITIDEHGNLLNTKVLNFNGSDAQVYTIALWQTGPVLIGGSNQGGNWKGFVVSFWRYPSLSVVAQYHIGTSNSQETFLGQTTLGGQPLLLGYSYTLGEYFLLPATGNQIVQGDFQNLVGKCFKTEGTGTGRAGLFDHQAGPNQKALFFYHYAEQQKAKATQLLKFNISPNPSTGALEVDYNPVWRRRFNFDNHILNVLPVHSNQDKYLFGTAGLLAKTDWDFNSCVNEELPNVGLTERTFSKFPLTMEITEKNPDIDPLEVIVETISPTYTQLCPPTLQVGENSLLQSPYLYLQAAGSKGEDSTPGIHLRWHLLRNLGENHLPKGDYASTTHNFNKKDDFVRIYRAPYAPVGHVYQIANKVPFAVNHQDACWIYKNPGMPVLYLFWRDKVQYQNVLNSVSPSNGQAVDQFFQAYGANLLEFEIKDELAFAATYMVVAQNTVTVNLRSEAFSVEGNVPGPAHRLTARQDFKSQDLPNMRVVTENLRFLRFTLKDGILRNLNIETYSAFLNQALQGQTIEKIGDFALTKQTSEALLRLEKTPGVPVHNLWRKFNGNARVNVQNYKDRWENNANPGTGILKGVTEYIALSDAAANPAAQATLTADSPDTPDMQISYLNMLLLAGIDFHAARMLGMGHIDQPPGTSQGHPNPPSSDPYIYIAEYHTTGELDDGNGARPVQHLFLSVPTAQTDERLPEELAISNLTYGLTVQQNTPTPLQITDNNGYTPDGLSRFINIWADLKIDYSQSNGFFQPSVLFRAVDFTPAVLGGLEYAKQGQNWQNPELAHEGVFKDTANVAETTPIVFREGNTKPFFVHQEQDPGIHKYAAYAVNIFSRASGLSTEKATDMTQFTKTNTLLPPSDFRVQLIQPEGPLLLTTQAEQDTYDTLAGDKTLVRATFNYTHIHDINYDFGNKVEVFFRQELPRNITGGVLSVTEDYANNRLAVIAVQSYTYSSNGQTVTPNLPQALIDHFTGGVLVVNSNRYLIHSIQLLGNNPNAPVFKVFREEDRSMQSGGGQIAATQTFLPINAVAGDLFMVIENMAKAQSWGSNNPLSTVIEIGNNQWTSESESFVNNNGDTITRTLRGLWDNATLSVFQTATEVVDSNTGQTKVTAIYKIEFDTLKLNHHPQWNGSDPVDWYKGVVRIPLKNDPSAEKRALPVIGTEHVGDGQHTVLYAYDNEPHDPNRFDTSCRVNFYPGYRAYLHRDIPKGFNEAGLLPATGEGSRQTLMGVRSWDTTNGYRSPLGIPAILLAQEIVLPLTPEKPLGPLYAPPPDQYRKSAYTFSVKLASRPAGQKPYALVFYRGDLNAVLNALYTQSTINSIRGQLPDPGEDAFFTSRWKNLVSLDYHYSDPTDEFYDAGHYNPDGAFRMFPAQNGFRFPKPDNPKYGFDGTQEPGAIDDLMREAIFSNFQPLTKQPLLYQDIENNTAPSLGMPAIPGQVPETVQFTDYSLDGAMTTSYFYCAREMGNKLQLGEYSPAMGPIQLIDTAPPATPVVQKVVSQIADPVLNISTAVRFELAPFAAYENIRRIHIYRSRDPLAAMSVRAMGPPVKSIELDVAMLQSNPLVIEDDFSGSLEIPFGEPLYYRLVALKEVNYVDLNNQPVIDFVPSIPTRIFLSNAVDAQNPAPPEIAATVTSNANDQLSGLKLTWNKTAYNGTYYLFRMSSGGNWNKIFEVKSNIPTDLEYHFSDPLPKKDDEDLTVYYRFKVTVENTSGLLNLVENILTL